MPKTRFSDEEILAALVHVEHGATIGDVAERLGVSDATVYAWQNRFKGFGSPQFRELRQLRAEVLDLRGQIAALIMDRVRLLEALDAGAAPTHGRHSRPVRAFGDLQLSTK